MNIILLVQTPEDAAALVPAAAGIKALSPTALWLVHSPAVLVDLGTSNAQTEQQIAAIQQAIKDCIGREDYTGAEQYKQQRHALTLQKATAATEGYKTMTPQQVEEATTRVFGEFWKAQPAPKMGLTMHSQHHEKGDWIEMLNSMKGRWAAEMKHGEFIVAWPGQFVPSGPVKTVAEIKTEIFKQLAGPAPTLTPPSEPKKRKTPSGYMGHPRFKQLCSTGIDALGQMALTYKINPDGMNRLKLAHAIGKHEEAHQLLDNPKA